MNGRIARAGALTAGGLCIGLTQGGVISGTVSDWLSAEVLVVGDGVDHVSIFWSINTANRGWFYGSQYNGDSDVAFADGITNITQIADASRFTYTAWHIGPHVDAEPNGIGDFIVWRHTTTGHYGVLRIDDIAGTGNGATLEGTWWFQTDGTGNFVPAPGASAILPVAVAVAMRRRRA